MMRLHPTRALKLNFPTIPPPKIVGSDIDGEKARTAIVDVQIVTTIRIISQVDGS